MNKVPDKSELKIVGTRPIRPDGVDKVTGKAAYGADYSMPGMLVGAIKRSPYPHARIAHIDTSKAMALPGVKAVVTGADFPELKPGSEAQGEVAIDVSDIGKNCMARDKALYVGHAVAAVAATSADIAAEALDLIEVVYDKLPAVFDVEDAMKPDAPLLHEDMITQGLPEVPDKPSNIANCIMIPVGDAAKAIAEADVVAEGTYTTKPVHQGYIEPHACVASVSADGQAQIWCSSQGAFMVRSYTAEITGMNLADVRVTPAEIGGGFGGKTTVYLEPLAVMLSRKSGRPVKMVMSRTEVFEATGPAVGGIIHVRLGATKDGLITGAEVEVKYQSGAFPDSATAGAAAATAVTAYKIPNVTARAWDVVSNLPNMYAYRAPGAPQTNFAVESVMDDLARELGMDPIELREKNAVKHGDTAFFGVPFYDIGFEQTLAAAKEHPHYSAPLGPNQGRGLAAGFWLNYGGESSVMVNINEDGTAVVATGNPDIGGTRASISMMAAETLGLPLEKVRPIVADTASIGFSYLTGGSRTAFATGMAVVNACQELIEDMKGRAAITWGVEKDQVGWEDGKAVCLDPEADKEPLSIADIAANAGQTGGAIVTELSINAQGHRPTFCIHLCDVEVDKETGHVKVLRYTVLQDVGRAVHPSYVEGQMQGGASQSIGWALNEEYIFDSEGRLDNPSFLDYRMPVASDLPMIDTVMVEVLNPDHPYGVKGVGEVPLIPGLAAVNNAVRDATGKRFFDLPLSPPRIRAGLNGGT